MGKVIDLGIFASENIQKATLSLLSDLGIEMEVRSQQQIPIPAIVAASLGKTPKAVQDICDKIAESYLVGIISDKTFTGEDNAISFEEACKNTDRYEQMMVFAVDFIRDRKITRSEMATLTRSLNRASKACPVVLVCRYSDEDGTRFAFSLCERTAYKQAGHTGEKAGKVNILRGINPEKPHTGHVRILEDMRLDKTDNTFGAVYDKWFGVFDNDVLTNQFYKELQDWFFWAVKHVQFPNDINDETDDKKYNPQNVIRLITRLIFIWFLRQKGLVPKELFNREDLAHLVKDFEPDNFESSTYYRVILQNLFFATLNKKIDERAFISDSFIENRNLGKHNIKTYMRHAKDLAVSKEEFIKLVHPVPFMNNSLFECLDNKVQNGHTYNWDGFSDSNKPQRQAFIPNYLFFAKEEYVDLSEEYDSPSKSSVKVSGLLTILKKYNFTVEENTPLDQDVALDPELLGKVFENLLAAYNPETEKTVRKSTGSYYTPRPIVQYMVDESLISYLKKTVGDVDEATLRSLLSYSDDDKTSTLNEQQTRSIVEAILNCKVLDPACGSGAFPMGMLQQMSHLLSRVDATNKYWEEVVINRALNDEAFVDTMNDEEKEAHKHEIEEVFKLSVNYPDYARKLYLIENCIYGVDIQSIAVQISRLRFFISLVCEQQPSNDASKNYNIKPLPNLEMKFVSANSLVRLEHIDEARELFANKDILDLIAKLKGVRHELFIVTDHHVRDRLLQKDDTLRAQIMLSTGECYVKGTEEKIKGYEQSISRLEKELVVAERQPDDVVQQSVQYDLFGEKKEIVSVNRKEVKIKEISSNIRYFKRECKRLKETLTSGRDKAVRLAKQLTDWNPYDQNVSSPFFDPEWMFGVKDGFDVIIGNPPYINVENLDDSLKEYLFSHYKTCTGRTDIYIGFIEKSLSMMANNCTTTFIIPFSYTNQNYAEASRSLLVNNYSVDELLDTSNYLVFKNAMVKNITIRFSKNGGSYTKIKVVGSENDFINKNFNESIIETSQFNLLKGCRLETKGGIKFLGIKSKIDENSFRLEKIFTIAYGVRVNHKTDKAKPKSYYVHNEFQTSFKPFIEGKYIQRYSHEQCGWLDYKPSEHYNAMYPELFENEKIITINVVSERLRFSYDNKHLYNSHTVMNCVNIKYLTEAEHISAKKAIKQGDVNLARQYSTLFVLGVLNSKVTSWYFNKFQSEGLHFYPDDAKKLPIPHATQEDQSKIIEIVDKILQNKKEDSSTNTSLLESEIDQLIYHLYGLTYDEVLIVDPDTPIKREEYEKEM